jgi:hypothetical protein
MPRRPAARKDARQAASFDASRANSSFKMDVEEIIGVIAYVRHRKQKLYIYSNKLWVHPFVADRPTSGMFCKIYSDLRKYPGKFFSYLRFSIGSYDELLTTCEKDFTKQDHSEKFNQSIREAVRCNKVRIVFYYITVIFTNFH